MSGSNVFLAAAHADEAVFTDAWISLIGRLGGRRLASPDNPLVAVFSTPEQAVLACMALLDAPPPELARNRGLGVHVDQLVGDPDASGPSGADIAVALALEAAPRSASLSLAMRNAISDKVEIEFGAVEDLFLDGMASLLSLVRIRGEEAPEHNKAAGASGPPLPMAAIPDRMEEPSGRDNHAAPPSSAPQPTTIIEAMDADVDMTIVASHKNSEPSSGSREQIVDVTRRLSEAESRIELLIARGAVQAAFEALEQAIVLAGEHSATATSRQRFIARREELVENVKIVGPIVLRGEGLHAILLPMPVIALGRTSMDGAVADISLSYALVSRVQNGLRLSRSGSKIRFERLGGANSIFIDDAHLETGRAIDLDISDNDVVVALGGPADPPKPGDCRLKLARVGNGPSTIPPIVRCQVDLAHLGDTVSGDLEWHWPGWREDKAKTWIMFDEDIDIDVSASGSVSLMPTGSLGAKEPKARLRYSEDRGYFIEPLNGGIAIDGGKTTNPGPIRNGTIVHIADTKLSFGAATRR